MKLIHNMEMHQSSKCLSISFEIDYLKLNNNMELDFSNSGKNCNFSTRNCVVKSISICYFTLTWIFKFWSPKH